MTYRRNCYKYFKQL